MNYFRTSLLLAGMTALFLGIGFMLGGSGGMMVALLLALGMNGFAYWNSDKMVLGMYGAEPVDAQRAPELLRTVALLTRNAQMPMPKVFIIQNPQPNAFATGRDPEHASVAVTTGLLELLNPQEVAGVLAHELAHIKNRDTLIMTITATIAGAVTMLANFALFSGDSRNNPLGFVGVLLLMVVGPLAAGLVQMAISRTREYEADRMGAEISGRPLWLAGALEKMSYAAERIDNPDAERHPATAHMFIVNPLHSGQMDSLFSTHPATGNRIARLQAIAAENNTP